MEINKKTFITWLAIIIITVATFLTFSTFKTNVYDNLKMQKGMIESLEDDLLLLNQEASTELRELKEELILTNIRSWAFQLPEEDFNSLSMMMEEKNITCVEIADHYISWRDYQVLYYFGDTDAYLEIGKIYLKCVVDYGEEIDCSTFCEGVKNGFKNITQESVRNGADN